MTFERFERIVKRKHPTARLWPHGKFEEGIKSKINVAIEFNRGGKIYIYNGTYCEVLNRLKINAIYKHNLKACEEHLEWLKRTNGEKNIFSGKVIDKTSEIEELEKVLEDYRNNYVIV